MAEEGADARGHLRAKDMLELTGLPSHFLIAHLEYVGEQPFGEAMTSDEGLCTQAPLLLKQHLAVLNPDKALFFQGAEGLLGVLNPSAPAKLFPTPNPFFLECPDGF